MRNAELLHRFFDEGLEESSENVLFEGMASDTGLRSQFMEHLKIHSYIREDLATITTPASVTASLMYGLGLAERTAIVESGRHGLLKTASIVVVAIVHFAGIYRKYILTAAISAGVTAGLLLLLNEPAPLLNEPAPLPVNQESPLPSAEQQLVLPQNKQTSESAGTSLPESQAVLREDAESQAVLREDATELSASERLDDNAAVRNYGIARDEMENAAGLENLTTTDRVLPLIAAVDIPQAADMVELRRLGDAVSIEAASIEPFPEGAAVLKPESMHLFRRTPQTSAFSNTVFELRKLLGKSWPDVDLPHNSYTVFENMALSAVYKVTDHHAFGFEYGRETFGQEYSSFDMMRSNVLDRGIEIAYDPPVPWIAGEYRENKMLDMFGAVWKLSLPEYGMFGFFYPYTRTFFGATKQGPLAKLRVGLEMFPSNFSMLNVGVEYGILRYQIEQISYYTSKLNVTFGVALGF